MAKSASLTAAELLSSRGPPRQDIWVTRHTPVSRPAAPRYESEFELLALSPSTPTAVLSLSGLWGGTRSIRNYVSKVAPSKEALAAKGSIHMVHGLDVARAIVALHEAFTPGERWIVSDGRVYDCEFSRLFGMISPSDTSLLRVGFSICLGRRR